MRDTIIGFVCMHKCHAKGGLDCCWKRLSLLTITGRGFYIGCTNTSFQAPYCERQVTFLHSKWIRTWIVQIGSSKSAVAAGPNWCGRATPAAGGRCQCSSQGKASLHWPADLILYGEKNERNKDIASFMSLLELSWAIEEVAFIMYIQGA